MVLHFSNEAIDGLIESLSNSRLQYISYRDKIEQIIQETRHDIRRVDWQYEVPRLLSKALKHIDARFAVERNIAASARKKLDCLPPRSDEAQRVATVVQLVEDCLQCHVELHGLLMKAPSVFFDEQERQCFAPGISNH